MTKNSEENKLTIPILTGPTASGKTSLALALAEIYPQIEIISADSRQIYGFLKIGTDKPSEEIMARCKFHLVDCVNPGERFTAFDFVEESRKILADILDRGKRPLICGGTGLYIRSLAEGIFEIPEEDFSIRDNLEEEIITRGPEFLYKRLQAIDPEEAAKVHPNNVKRLIRALEIYYQTGKPKSNLINQTQYEPDLYNYDIVCLMLPRDELYRRINARVDAMIKAGLPDEVKTIMEKGLKDVISKINVIGYNELFRYFEKEISLETAINLIKQNSRRYAKRQITWFKGMKNIQFFDSEDVLKDYLAGYWNKN